jgi:large subunit ribosomal protein L29
MTYSEISKMSVDQLQKAVLADQAKLGKLEFSHAVTPLANPQEIRQMRRHIARLKTAITSKQQSLS